MSAGDPAMPLLRALVSAGAAAGAPPFELVEMASRAWASATFTGARHEIRLAVPDGPALAAWLAALPAAELPVPGHLVADVAVASVVRSGGTAQVVVEALTVEDR